MSAYADSRVLVVGGAGFVGSNLVATLLAESPEEIVVVDNLLSSERESIPADRRVTFVEESVNDSLDRIGTDYDYAFHLATFHGNQNSIADPLMDHENNVLPTMNLALAFSGAPRLKSLVYASAGCTVAEKTSAEPAPTTEDAPISAYHDSPYQVSKIVGELYLNFFWARHGLPVVKARFQNVYGPGEILGAGAWRGTDATVWRNVVPTFVYRAIRGLPLILHQNGEPTRDFIYVDDIVAGLMLCGTRGRAGEVYNLASGVESSIRDLASLVAECVGSAVELRVTPGRPWDRSGRRYGSTLKAHAELGFSAKTELAEGVSRTVAWTYDNLDRIEAAIARHRGRLDSLETMSL